MRVKNIEGNHGPIKNQFIIEDDNGAIFFQSYQTIIAKKENGKIILDREDWDYSPTTGRYRNIFLGENKAETEKKIKAGIYLLEDLS